MEYDNPEEVAKHIARLDAMQPGWREHKHANGARMWADNGMLLDDKGNRSIFDDVDD